MGGDNSGPKTVITKAWELAEFAGELISNVEQSLSDPDAPLDEKWLQWKREVLEKHRVTLKGAIQRERSKSKP